MTTVKLSEWYDSIYTRTICLCTDNRCDVDVSIEVISDGYVELGFDMEMVAQPNGNWDDWFWVGCWWRFKTAVKVLFMGRIDMNHHLLMDQKGIKEFREMLEESIAKVEEYYKKKEKK